MIGTEKRLRPCLKSVLIDAGLLRQNNFKKNNCHVIEYLLTELGRVEGEIFDSRSERTDLAMFSCPALIIILFWETAHLPLP